MMDVPGVDIAVRQEGDNVVLDVRGELDVTGAPELSRVVGDLVANGSPSLVLDLSAVTFVDSTGLSALVSGRNECRAMDGDLELRDPSQAAAKVLNITGLDQVFAIQSTS